MTCKFFQEDYVLAMAVEIPVPNARTPEARAAVDQAMEQCWQHFGRPVLDWIQPGGNESDGSLMVRYDLAMGRFTTHYDLVFTFLTTRLEPYMGEDEEVEPPVISVASRFPAKQGVFNGDSTPPEIEIPSNASPNLVMHDDQYDEDVPTVLKFTSNTVS